VKIQLAVILPLTAKETGVILFFVDTRVVWSEFKEAREVKNETFG